MLDIIKQIVELQANWSAEHTPEMQDRAVLIRDTLPDALREIVPQLSKELNVPEEDVGITGGDGSTAKAAIPWVRIYSKKRSPNPREGWYLVILFHSEGGRLYLCLSHGSTDWAGTQYKRKPAEVIEPLMDWASDLLKPFFTKNTGLVHEISLGSHGKLGRSYEASTPVAKQYSSIRLPSENSFEEDILLFARMLRLVYENQELGRTPISATDAFEKAQKDFAGSVEIARSGTGQGFGLSASERRAIENHAMETVKDYLASQGYSLEITSNYASYDILARKKEENEELIVEVKGTTSAGSHIFMTANEVEVHQQRHPNNALCIVHSINLKRDPTGDKPTANGGTLVIKKGWDINECAMRAIAYQVKL